MVLHEDSTLTWYSDRGESSPEGGIFLKDSPEMIAAGQFTAQIPNRPEFPDGSDIRSAIAFGSRTKPTVQWFVFRNEPTMMDWIRSISDTVKLQAVSAKSARKERPQRAPAKSARKECPQQSHSVTYH